MVSNKTVVQLAQKWRDRFYLGMWRVSLDCIPEEFVVKDDDKGTESAAYVDYELIGLVARIVIATKRPLEEVDRALCHEYAHLAIAPMTALAVRYADRLGAEAQELALQQIDAAGEEAVACVTLAVMRPKGVK